MLVSMLLRSGRCEQNALVLYRVKLIKKLIFLHIALSIPRALSSHKHEHSDYRLTAYLSDFLLKVAAVCIESRIQVWVEDEMKLVAIVGEAELGVALVAAGDELQLALLLRARPQAGVLDGALARQVLV